MKKYKLQAKPRAAPDTMAKFLKASLKEDFSQSVRLYFSPFVALAKDFHDSMGQLKTFDYPSSAKNNPQSRHSKKRASYK